MRAHMAYFCAGGQPEHNPCPMGGSDHTPWPRDYWGAGEYADQMLSEGWKPKRCPSCDLWAIWIPPMPMPQPPNRYVYDDPNFQAHYDETVQPGDE